MTRFGLTAEHEQLLTDIVIAPLSKQGASIFVFGSRARGDYKKFSDLDIVVEGVVPASLISGIRESLEESSLPFRVDIVQIHELADSYREGVLRDRVAIGPTENG